MERHPRYFPCLTATILSLIELNISTLFSTLTICGALIKTPSISFAIPLTSNSASKLSTCLPKELRATVISNFLDILSHLLHLLQAQ